MTIQNNYRQCAKGICLAFLLLVTTAESQAETLYEEMGGLQKIVEFVDVFVEIHPRYPEVNKHFEHTNMQRFRSKFIEFLCEVADGPCEYTGDTMLLTHGGMHISEAEFNGSVNMMIDAMDRVGLSIGVRNQILARLAPMRADIIYQ